MVEYLKNKSGKIIAVVWENGGTSTASIVVGGAVLLAIGVTALAWWKTQHPQTRLTACHTCR